MFPKGIPEIYRARSQTIPGNQWSHQDISKFDLANAIQLDLEEFCLTLDQFLDNVSYSYPNPPFEIPDYPINHPKKVLKSR